MHEISTAGEKACAQNKQTGFSTLKLSSDLAPPTTPWTDRNPVLHDGKGSERLDS